MSFLEANQERMIASPTIRTMVNKYVPPEQVNTYFFRHRFFLFWKFDFKLRPRVFISRSVDAFVYMALIFNLSFSDDIFMFLLVDLFSSMA